ncbi:MAG: hypothetical protein SWK76_16535 [Actinomycetota bacterium]|nr:hypothetical protein [Actinomycetota bacterium]
MNPGYPEVYTFIMSMKARWPGIDPPDSICQLLEDEVMLKEDYDWIVGYHGKVPWLSYLPFFVKIISRV